MVFIQKTYIFNSFFNKNDIFNRKLMINMTYIDLFLFNKA